jgi:uncharacterized protein YbcI
LTRQNLSHASAAQEDEDEASAISRGVVQIYANLYGRGPDRANTFAEESHVLTVLHGCFTPAERTLIEAGRAKQVEDTRRAFQEAVREEFIGVVEEATDRKVESFLSQTDIRNDVHIEFFLLKAEGTAA